MALHTTNYFDTFIEVAGDTKVDAGTMPAAKGIKKTIAQMQYELLANHPYQYTSDDVLFRVYAERNDLTATERKEAKDVFFSKGQPCLRASPLPKTCGFGVHYDSAGKVAIYGVETPEYEKYTKDQKLQKLKAMRNTRKI